MQYYRKCNMCGICGQYYYKGKHRVSIQTLKKMNDMITHRGPDDEGYHTSDSLGLGIRRFSVIDLSGEKADNHKIPFCLIILENWMRCIYSQNILLTLFKRSYSIPLEKSE